MDEARTVLSRLERIEALERSHADPATLLAELRELVREAEVWARREQDPRAEAAARRLAAHAPPATPSRGDGDRPAGKIATLG